MMTHQCRVTHLKVVTCEWVLPDSLVPFMYVHQHQTNGGWILYVFELRHQQQIQQAEHRHIYHPRYSWILNPKTGLHDQQQIQQAYILTTIFLDTLNPKTVKVHQTFVSSSEKPASLANLVSHKLQYNQTWDHFAGPCCLLDCLGLGRTNLLRYHSLMTVQCSQGRQNDYDQSTSHCFI